jgi:hypothetical protein
VRGRVLATAVICGGALITTTLAVALMGPSARAAAQAGDALRSPGVRLAGGRVGGSPQECEAYAYAAIKRHQVITGTPAACRGLSRAQVSRAASAAINASLTERTKSARRKQAGAAAVWVRALISYLPPPLASPPVAQSSGQPQAGAQGDALGLGGVSELAAKVGALLAWLAAAASGGFVLVRWLLAGGSPLRGTVTSAPPAVILGHVGGGALGLALWAAFMLSGRVAVAWTALALLAPVAGLGMGVLLLGLPAPARAAVGARGGRGPGPRARIPVLVIAAHGVFAVTALLLVLMATIGAG